MVKQYLKEELVKGIKLFWDKGLSAGKDMGDISIRDRETNYIYICPRPSDNLKIPNWTILEKEHVVVIDIEGNLIEDHNILPTVEAPMHTEIYKSRPEIGAIVHSHAVWSSAFSSVGKNIPFVIGEQLYLGGEIVCAEYGKAGSREIAQNVVMALGKNKMAALMRNHGAVSLGLNLEDAFINSDFLEKNAKTVLLGSLLGDLLVIKPD
jgi:L-ribulose-5-phosphate 4-epimerase